VPAGTDGSGPPAARPRSWAGMNALGRVIRKVDARSPARSLGTGNVGNARGRPDFMLPLGRKLKGTLPFQPVDFRNVRPHRTRRGSGRRCGSYGRARQDIAAVDLGSPVMMRRGSMAVELRVVRGRRRYRRYRDQNDRRCFENHHRQPLPTNRTNDAVLSPAPWTRCRGIQD
jgi:hypothetical protein